MDIYLSSSIKQKSLEDIVQYANDKNLNLEISRFGSIKTIDNEFDEKLFYYKKVLENFKGKLSLHGFFFDLNPSSTDPEIRKITQKRYEQSFFVAKELGAKTVVFHTGYNILLKHDGYVENFVLSQISFWENLIKHFENENITVVLENTYEDKIEPIISIVDEINSPYLKMCLDAGHANINGDDSIENWIDKIGKRLHHCHFHNNYGKKDEHNSLIRGTVDFSLVIEKLKQNKLSPNIVLEIFNQELVEESLDFLNQKIVKTTV